MPKHYIQEELRDATAGHVLYHDFILKENITFKEVAKRMGVSACTVTAIIDNERDITDVMAQKLADAFPETTLEFWKGHRRNKLRFHKGKVEADRYW